MKRLILMRHAKSSWDHPGMSDHERPLNARGIRSAKALGEWLTERNFTPDEILSSSSTRTRETFANLGLRGDVQWLDRLYHAAPEDMLRALMQATEHTVLMLGHNPGIAEFAQDVVEIAPDHPRFDDYPTGATLVAEFDIDDWSLLEMGTGRTLAFVVPRELTGE
jgi:phosphohistidine phosphatase